MIQLIYRKVLKLPPTAGFNSGKIMNLIANDAQFFADTMTNFIGGLVAPIQVIVAFGLLWQHIGPYALLTLAIMAIMLPFAAILTKQVQKIRQDVQQALDKRLKLLNELVLGIRIIKFYAWESSFKMNIRASRETELRFVKKMGLNRAYMLSVIGNTTTVVIGVTFLFYGLFGSQGLNPAAAFATLALINLLRLPFFLLPFTANLLNQYRVTFERIQSIISMPELTVKESKPKKNLVIRIKHADFSWDGKSKALKNINLKIKKGELLIVVGKVGSGKSTLAMSLLGELVTISGKRAATDSIAYVPQEVTNNLY
jgi:ABC-type multidrug transport system fused ATPase/permease subunit